MDCSESKSKPNLDQGHTEQEKIEEPKNSEHNINEKALYEDELMSLIEELRSNEDDQKKD